MKLTEKINFYFEDIETPLGRAVDFCIIGLVILACFIFVFQTYDLSPQLRRTTDVAEFVIMSLFVGEYLLRLLVSDNKLRRFLNIYSLIDLLTILPFILSIFIPFHFEIFQVLRIFRVLRLVRYFQNAKIIAKSVGEDVFITLRLLFTFFSITFIFSGFLFYIEHEANPREFGTLFDSFYFSIVALSTVGFGDIAPVTQVGRLITILMIISGILFIPWQLSDFIKRVVR